MPSLSSTYLLPAILLNPAFILHLINTFVSHLVPPPPTPSVSPHPFMESIGPVPGSKPYMDMHADDQLCWSYTAIMVFVQILAFGRVQDNRVQRKSAKAAKVERERARKEKLALLVEERKRKGNGHVAGLDGMCDMLEEWDTNTNGHISNGNGVVNGVSRVFDGKPRVLENGLAKEADARVEVETELEPETESEESLTETSEEEMFI